MKIAIDARETKSGQAGKGRYVTELIKAISTIDSKNEYLLFTKDIKPQIDLPNNFKWAYLNGNSYTRAYKSLKKEKIDLFFSPTSYLMAAISPVPCIVVVHDLAVFLEKRSRPTFKTKLLERIGLPLALRRAKKIIAVSDNTKKDLIKLFNTRPEKIASIPLAPFISTTTTPVKEVIQKFSLPKQFVLFVGTLEPRKNIDTLLIGYANLSKEIRRLAPLVLVGKRGWQTEKIDQIIRDYNLSGDIKELGFVADADMPGLFSSASVLAYPSWYEGFGLPVVEAMNYGCPVITSNTSSLPQVAGDAAILVNPSNHKEITDALKNVLTDSSLQDELSKKSLRQAKQFTWQKTAQETLTVFGEIK